MKKNLIILTVALSAILITLLVLIFLNLGGQKSGEAQISGGLIPPDYYPKKLSKSSVKFFSLKTGGKVVFYEELESAIYESGYEGNSKRELARVPNAYDIVFSPDGRQIIATIIERGGFRKFYLNLTGNERVQLHPNIKSLAFSPDGNRIAYHFYDNGTGEGNISVSNPDGSVFKNIFKTRIKNPKILWLEKNIIIIYTGESPELAFSIDPNGDSFKKLNEPEISLYFGGGTKDEQILNELGIEATAVKTDALGNYLIYTNKNDGSLYSLKIR